MISALMVACSGSSATPRLSNGGEVVVTYVVSGGIAGDTTIDLALAGDGVLTEAISGRSNALSTERIQSLSDDLARAGACDLNDEPLDSGPTRLADGFSVQITIRCSDGVHRLDAYGLRESPASYDQGLLTVSGLLDELASELRPVAP